MPAKRDLQRHALRPPSPRRSRTTARPPGSGGRRSSDTGRSRSRGSTTSIWLRSHTILKPVERQVGVDVLDQRRLGRDHVAPARRSRRRSRCRRARRSCAAPALRPCRRIRRTAPTPSRRPSSGRPRAPACGRRCAAAAPRAETARRRKSARPGQITPPRYSPFAVTASSVVAVPKSTTISGRPRPLPNCLERGDAVDDAIGADFRRVLVEDRHAGVGRRARRPARSTPK